MAISNQLIYAPSIYLFAFQQQQEFFFPKSLESISPEWLTNRYGQILNNFYVCQKIKFNSRTDNDNLVNPQKTDLPSISQSQKFLGTIKTQENLELIQGEAYPNCINNSYIISLKINRSEKNANQAISVEKLAQFNPKNCFSPYNINTNLGQTVVITALVNNRENIQPESLQCLANSCVSSFAHLPSNSATAVSIDASFICNGYFFTYYLPGNSRQYNQIIVCLFFNQQDRDNFQHHHQQLAKFLLSFHKRTYIYQHSHSLLKLACYQIGQLKYHLKTSSNNHLSQISSNNFEIGYTPISDHWQKSDLAKTDKKPVAVLN